MTMRDIVVIGGSAGSGQVLRKIVADFPSGLHASVFIVTHLPANGSPYLTEALRAHSALPVSTANDGQPAEPGHIYVAPPDRHLVLVDRVMRLGEGPRENLVRPAIDPLFRSAAFTARERVIGVVLTGALNDGAAGLAAIKRCGGLTVVQHPLDAEVNQMPLAALEAVEADHIAAAADLGSLITKLVAEPTEASSEECPESLELEVMIALGRRLGSERLAAMASPSPLSCPHCHGVLSQMETEGPLRFRCQTGHAFTAEAALIAQEAEVDEALRIALRVMEERCTLVTRMARDARAQGRRAVAELYEARAAEYERYASTLREAATVSLRLSQGLPPAA